MKLKMLKVNFEIKNISLVEFFLTSMPIYVKSFHKFISFKLGIIFSANVI